MKNSLFSSLIVASIVLGCAGGAQAQAYRFTTIAGWANKKPVLGATGDGTNNGARFFSPYYLALDPGQNLYVTDGEAIRKVSPIGTNWVVTTLAGQGVNHGSVDGTNSGALFDFPQGIAVDQASNLYIADTYNDTIRQLMPVGTNWVSSTIAGMAGAAGNSNGASSGARFNNPYGIAVDLAGNLYVADTLNDTIREMSPAGTNWLVSTIAGVAGTPGSADGTNTAATFYAPVALAVDTNGNLYVADFMNDTIRKMTRAGTNWVVTTLAGSAGISGSADGTNTSAHFSQPSGIAVDAVDNLFVSDSGNNTIRRLKAVGTNWVVSTVAGLAGTMGSTDGAGTNALFNVPAGIAVDPLGNLFVSDSANFTIRQGHIAALLQIARVGSKVVVSWPLALAGYVCETSSTASGGAWSLDTNNLGFSGDYVVQTNNIAPGNAFFRLSKP